MPQARSRRRVRAGFDAASTPALRAYAQPERGVLGAAFLLLLCPTLALAQTVAPPPAPTPAPAEAPPPAPPAVPTAEQVARQELEVAERHYDLGRFKEAIRHYTRAYEAVAHPALLFNIAQCHRHRGRTREAAFFYRRYLDLQKAPPNEKVARQLLEEMEARNAAAEEEARAERALARALKAPHPAEEPPAPPLYKRTWFWVAAGAVLAAGATAVAVSAAQPAGGTLGTVDAR